MSHAPLRLCARDHVLDLRARTQIMGIVNCTPDSFSGDGKLAAAACVKMARRRLAEGADILDIGGESTRPGSHPVSVKEEVRRVIPVIEKLCRSTKVPVSVDTSKTEVARQALDAGASIINNIQGNILTLDLLKIVRDYKAAIVVVHMRGTPKTMQAHARYKDVVKETIAELQISVEKCLQVGIKKDRIIVDAGIGFAKTAEHNLSLIRHLGRLKVLGCPIMLGTSRKSFIGRILDKGPQELLMGTAATVTAGVLQGANIVRVHDVAAIRETLKVTEAIRESH